ncbi:MAG TPA: UDP-N-acetylmuramoyl-L-alanyl-D-glutamate--2,6-diaminopimelate ligase [Longimicrobiales bacterium]
MSSRLSAIASRLEQAGLLVQAPAHDTDVLDITDDSRAVRNGSLFCAWAGNNTDAHAFVAGAASAGAAGAIVERAVPDAHVPQIVVRDGRRAAAVAADVFFGDPQRQLTLAGVTGTNGKTTTVWILRHLMSSRTAASLGTLGVILENGVVLPGSEKLTTPGPVELVRTLRLLVDRGVTAVAMEVSSHALDQGRVSTLRFDAAVFTNLTRDHLDYHGTLEAYLAAKRSLVELLRPNGCAVTNADDSAWEGLGAKAPRALTFGLDAGADVRCENLSLGSFGARFTMRTSDSATSVQLPLLGDFNVHNALGAATACIAIGFAPSDVARSLSTVPQVPGRLERIATTPCPVLRDYAHTPDALERALSTLRPLTEGRLIVVFGAGGDRDRGKRPQMGAAAQQGADVAIVTSDNPRTEDPNVIIDDITAGMKHGYVRIADRRDAIAHAISIAQQEDVILLAGKGHENYQIVGTTKLPFDERVVVRELAGKAGA